MDNNEIENDKIHDSDNSEIHDDSESIEREGKDELEKLIIQAIREQAMKEIFRERITAIRRKEKIKKIVFYVFSAAAIIILCLFIPKWVTNAHNKEVATKYIANVAYYPESASKSSEQDQNQAINLIIKDLKREDSDKKKVISAADSIMQYISSEQKKIYNVMYLKALCYLYESNKDSTKIILQSIADEDFSNQEAAQQLLEEISK